MCEIAHIDLQGVPISWYTAWWARPVGTRTLGSRRWARRKFYRVFQKLVTSPIYVIFAAKISAFNTFVFSFFAERCRASSSDHRDIPFVTVPSPHHHSPNLMARAKHVSNENLTTWSRIGKKDTFKFNALSQRLLERHWSRSFSPPGKVGAFITVSNIPQKKKKEAIDTHAITAALLDPSFLHVWVTEFLHPNWICELSTWRYFLSGLDWHDKFSMWSHDVVNTSVPLAADLKIGQYLKIPPRVMFLIQVWGTIFG